jgi:hypothetical protein
MALFISGPRHRLYKGILYWWILKIAITGLLGWPMMFLTTSAIAKTFNKEAHEPSSASPPPNQRGTGGHHCGHHCNCCWHQQRKLSCGWQWEETASAS